MGSIQIGSPLYLGIIWGLSAVFLGVAALLSKNQIRIAGASSWFVLVVFGSAGAFAALPIASLAGMGYNYALPLVALAFVISVPIIHWVIPAVAEDFQTQNFGTTLMLCFLIGIAVLVAAFASGQAASFLPAGVFEGPGAFPSE